MHPVLFVARLWLASALVTPAGESAPTCLDTPPSASAEARCLQLAAAARLRGGPVHPTPQPVAAGALGPAGKGALAGLGIGLAIGLVAGLVAGPACEEGHAGCTAGLIVGGAVLGAGIGALVGAVAGQD